MECSAVKHAMTKNIKISDVTHEALEHEKREGETFDDTIRRLLDLGIDRENLLAYFSDDLAKAANDLIEETEANGDYEEALIENGMERRLEFKLPDSGVTIARFDVTEDEMRIYYLAMNDEMEKYGFMSEDEDGVYWFKYSRKHDYDELCEQYQRRVRGATKRWTPS